MQMTNLEHAIRDLVGAHELFWKAKSVPHERRTATDWQEIKDWGRTLKASQEYLGIDIVDPLVIDRNVSEAETALEGAP